MRYRRANTANATYFFTVNLAERNKSLLTENIDLLRTVMRKVKQRHPFIIEAMVILPDHLHALGTLPEGDANFAMRWSLFKSGFSRAISKTERINASRIGRRERGIWQRRYWEHQIRNRPAAAYRLHPLRSNTAMPGRQATGRIPAFIGISGRVNFLWTGVVNRHMGATLGNKVREASSIVGLHASAQPTLP